MFGCERTAWLERRRELRAADSVFRDVSGENLDRDNATEPRVARAVPRQSAGAETIGDLYAGRGSRAWNGDDYTDPTLNPYLTLLRTNRNFRLLFIGQGISQLGDWFNTVAVFALILDLTQDRRRPWRG